MKSIHELARAGRALTHADIIDVHAHLGPSKFPVPGGDPESLLKCAERAGVRELWVSRMGFGSPDFAGCNQEIFSVIRKYPGRFRGYATPPPSSAEEARKETELCLELGFLGIKLHNSTGIQYDAPEYEPVWSIADERRLPVLLHTWGNPEEMDCVEKFSDKYKGASIIMGHGVVGRNTGRYEKLAANHENVYLDTCLSSAPRGRFEELVARVGPEKLLFGSDTVFLSLTHQLGRIALAGITEEDKILILSKNAESILKLARG